MTASLSRTRDGLAFPNFASENENSVDRMDYCGILMPPVIQEINDASSPILDLPE